MVLVAPARPEPLATAEEVRLDVAGAESTVALYLNDLGIDARWASRVGADPAGTRVLNSLRAHGVDTSLVVVDDTRPTAVFLKDPGQESTAVYYYRSGSAASALSEDDLPRLVAADADLVHITGITAAISASAHGLAVKLVVGPRAAKPVVSFDVNYRARLWHSVAAAAASLTRLARAADIVFVGQDEAEALWGTATIRQTRDHLRDVPHLVVKDGGHGATAFTSEEEVFVPASQVDVVEVVGAGDAFAAGYLRELLTGGDLRASLERGHAVAAWALSSTRDFVPSCATTPETPADEARRPGRVRR